MVEEKGCEHEGLRLDIERMALEPGRMAVILVAMMPGEVNDRFVVSQRKKGRGKNRGTKY